MNSAYNSIVQKLPHRPLVIAAIRRSGLSNEEIAKRIHVNPTRFRAYLDGTETKSGALRINHLLALRQVLDCKSIDKLMYTPKESISTSMEQAIIKVAEAICDNKTGQIARAFDGLRTFEIVQVNCFYLSIFENPECFQVTSA